MKKKAWANLKKTWANLNQNLPTFKPEFARVLSQICPDLGSYHLQAWSECKLTPNKGRISLRLFPNRQVYSA